MALRARREGSVVLLATIAEDGTIRELKTISGDPMLVQATTDAVKQWRYRPYLLNGKPTRMQTQITVRFKAP
jgi:protein TonB